MTKETTDGEVLIVPSGHTACYGLGARPVKNIRQARLRWRRVGEQFELPVTAASEWMCDTPTAPAPLPAPSPRRRRRHALVQDYYYERAGVPRSRTTHLAYAARQERVAAALAALKPTVAGCACGACGYRRDAPERALTHGVREVRAAARELRAVRTDAAAAAAVPKRAPTCADAELDRMCAAGGARARRCRCGCGRVARWSYRDAFVLWQGYAPATDEWAPGCCDGCGRPIAKRDDDDEEGGEGGGAAGTGGQQNGNTAGNQQGNGVANGHAQGTGNSGGAGGTTSQQNGGGGGATQNGHTVGKNHVNGTANGHAQGTGDGGDGDENRRPVNLPQEHAVDSHSSGSTNKHKGRLSDDGLQGQQAEHAHELRQRLEREVARQQHQQQPQTQEGERQNRFDRRTAYLNRRRRNRAAADTPECLRQYGPLDSASESELRDMSDASTMPVPHRVDLIRMGQVSVSTDSSDSDAHSEDPVAPPSGPPPPPPPLPWPPTDSSGGSSAGSGRGPSPGGARGMPRDWSPEMGGSAAGSGLASGSESTAAAESAPGHVSGADLNARQQMHDHDSSRAVDMDVDSAPVLAPGFVPMESQQASEPHEESMDRTRDGCTNQPPPTPPSADDRGPPLPTPALPGTSSEQLDATDSTLDRDLAEARRAFGLDHDADLPQLPDLADFTSATFDSLAPIPTPMLPHSLTSFARMPSPPASQQQLQHTGVFGDAPANTADAPSSPPSGTLRPHDLMQVLPPDEMKKLEEDLERGLDKIYRRYRQRASEDGSELVDNFASKTPSPVLGTLPARKGMEPLLPSIVRWGCRVPQAQPIKPAQDEAMPDSKSATVQHGSPRPPSAPADLQASRMKSQKNASSLAASRPPLIREVMEEAATQKVPAQVQGGQVNTLSNQLNGTALSETGSERIRSGSIHSNSVGSSLAGGGSQARDGGAMFSLRRSNTFPKQASQGFTRRSRPASRPKSRSRPGSIRLVGFGAAMEQEEPGAGAGGSALWCVDSMRVMRRSDSTLRKNLKMASEAHERMIDRLSKYQQQQQVLHVVHKSPPLAAARMPPRVFNPLLIEQSVTTADIPGLQPPCPIDDSTASSATPSLSFMSSPSSLGSLSSNSTPVGNGQLLSPSPMLLDAESVVAAAQEAQLQHQHQEHLATEMAAIDSMFSGIFQNDTDTNDAMALLMGNDGDGFGDIGLGRAHLAPVEAKEDENVSVSTTQEGSNNGGSVQQSVQQIVDGTQIPAPQQNPDTSKKGKQMGNLNPYVFFFSVKKTKSKGKGRRVQNALSYTEPVQDEGEANNDMVSGSSSRSSSNTSLNITSTQSSTPGTTDDETYREAPSWWEQEEENTQVQSEVSSGTALSDSTQVPKPQDFWSPVEAWNAARVDSGSVDALGIPGQGDEKRADVGQNDLAKLWRQQQLQKMQQELEKKRESEETYEERSTRLRGMFRRLYSEVYQTRNRDPNSFFRHMLILPKDLVKMDHRYTATLAPPGCKDQLIFNTDADKLGRFPMQKTRCCGCGAVGRNPDGKKEKSEDLKLKNESVATAGRDLSNIPRGPRMAREHPNAPRGPRIARERSNVPRGPRVAREHAHMPRLPRMPPPPPPSSPALTPTEFEEGDDEGKPDDNPNSLFDDTF